MLSRRRFLGTVSVSLISVPRVVEAQQKNRAPTIGILSPAVTAYGPVTEAFEGTLHRLGWGKDQTVRAMARRSHSPSRCGADQTPIVQEGRLGALGTPRRGGVGWERWDKWD